MSYPLLLSRAALAAVLALLSACGGGGDGPPGSSITIRSSTPADGATGVDRDVQPELTLSQAVVVATVSFTCADQPVAAEITGDGTHFRIKPAARLPALVTCKVRVKGGPTLTFTTADGAWAPVPQEINAGAGQAQSPTIAMDAKGGAVAVWRHEDNGVVTIRASRYAPASGWGTPQTLGTGGDPHVAMDAAGNAIVIWGGLEGGYWSVWSRRGTPDGNWSAAEVIENIDAGVDRMRIAMNAEGDAVATWMQEDAVAPYYNVWANRYVPGTGWESAQMVDRLNQQTLDPVVAVASGGVATVVWQQSDGDVYNIHATQSGRTGGWSIPAILDTSSRSTSEARVAASADGSFMVVWSQADAFVEVWANRFQPGAGWQGAIRVDAAPRGTYAADVAMDAEGGAVAVWVQNGTPDSTVWSRRYVPGHGWGTPAKVESAPFNASRPIVRMDGAGNALVVWHQWESAISTVWSNRLPKGGSWGQARRIGSTEIGEVGFPELAISADGSAISAWEHYDEGTYRILFNRFH